MTAVATRLGITASDIAFAKRMIADGNGRDTVAEELDLHKTFRPREYNRVLADLGLEW